MALIANVALCVGRGGWRLGPMGEVDKRGKMAGM